MPTEIGQLTTGAYLKKEVRMTKSTGRNAFTNFFGGRGEVGRYIFMAEMSVTRH